MIILIYQIIVNKQIKNLILKLKYNNKNNNNKLKNYKMQLLINQI